MPRNLRRPTPHAATPCMWPAAALQGGWAQGRCTLWHKPSAGEDGRNIPLAEGKLRSQRQLPGLRLPMCAGGTIFARMFDGAGTAFPAHRQSGSAQRYLAGPVGHGAPHLAMEK